MVSSVTKSGGNAFHGNAHYYYFGNRLNAVSPERLVIDPAALLPPYPVRYVQDDKQKSDNHVIGGAFGGPIVKDKLWFYTATSPRWSTDRRSYNFVDGSGEMSRSQNFMNWFSKVSWSPTDRIRSNFTYLYTPTYSTGRLYAYEGWEANSSTRAVANVAQ